VTRSKLTSRDYKRTRRSGMDLGRWREFGTGLAVGLVIALAAFTYARSSSKAFTDESRPQPHKVATASAEAGEPDESSKQYDFYEMLPKFEVVVPEKDRNVKSNLPAATIERPGVYVLQAGSYRNLADAERVCAQLKLQGVDAKVQRVAVDADVWHRVRIGPVNDLTELNRLRAKLRAADVDALVIQVGD
jgi:cell division protein FtsN